MSGLLSLQMYATEKDLETIEPQKVVNIDGAFMGADWNTNWFLQAQIGGHAFIGTPSGCGDLYDRMGFVTHLAVGKWITPTVGARLSFEGFRMKDADLMEQNFRNIHFDLMYNITNYMRDDYNSFRKWSCSPFIGVGMIKNSHSKAFAMTAGISVGYRLTDRLQLTAEAANTLTWQDFDRKGNSNKLGDNLSQLSVGLTYTIGKNGWQSVVDYIPLYEEYTILDKLYQERKEENNTLKAQQIEDQQAIQELKKILQIEGLLEKYNLHATDGEENIKEKPKNHYSGIVSLRKRLKDKAMFNNGSSAEPAYYSPSDTIKMTSMEYAESIRKGEAYVGTPVFFFFKKGNSGTIEEAQIVNIREIANAMKRFSLRAKIIGAADSMTGNTTTNDRLGIERAAFLKKKLREAGVKEDDITCEGRGGINDYRPLTANRNACVMLYAK